MEARFKGLPVVSVYVPSGSASEARQQAKLAFRERFMSHLAGLAAERRQYMLCGDWNIAYHPIDFRNWRANQKRFGLLPAERAWMVQLFGKTALGDAFRVANQSR